MNRSSLTRISSGNPLSFTNFGDSERSTFGSGLSGHPILNSERFYMLDYRQSYYDCTNHDSKGYDFDGRIVSQGPRAIMGMMSGEKAPFYVPLKMRRPSAPVRLSKVIVDSFTNLLFGEGRFPKFSCEADEVTEDFANTLAKVGDLETKMIRARNLGGSTGTVGLSWSFRDGKPRFDVHNAKNLYVHSWGDREQLLPKHIIEVYLYSDVRWDGKAFSKQYWWYRRDWTPNAEIVFQPCPYEEKKEPFWVPDLLKSYIHDDGVPHFEWIQNMPSDDTDGIPDYEGLFDTFETLDTMMSVVTRGATLNLDPTLLLKMDSEQVNRMGIRKGSDNALVVGKDGDASYMELGGEGLKAGIDIINALRRYALETAQCIVPDPSEVAAQGVSSVAIKTMFAPMIGKTNLLRSQYGRPMKRMLEVMIEVARSNLKMPVTIIDPETNEEVQAKVVLQLPPRVVKMPVPPPEPPKPPPPPKMVPHPSGDPNAPPIPDPNHDPTEGMSESASDDKIDPKEDPDGAAKEAFKEKEAQAPKVQLIEREPGEGEELDPKWGQYFTPTPDDLNKVATVFQISTGGKAFQSPQTAAEQMAQMMGLDPAEEWKRISDAAEQDKKDQAEMTPPIGGAVGGPNQLPPGAKPKPPGGGGGGGGGAPPGGAGAANPFAAAPKPGFGGPPKPGFGGPPKPGG